MIGAGAELFSPFCGKGERVFSMPMGRVFNFLQFYGSRQWVGIMFHALLSCAVRI